MHKGENHQPCFVEGQEDAQGVLHTDAWTGFEETVEFSDRKGTKRPFRKKGDYRQRHGDVKCYGLSWVTAKLFILAGKRKESVGEGVWRGKDD